MFGQDFLRLAAIGLPILLLSLTVHEYFHAWSAKKFGDDTAERMGRLTLNPIAHIDLLGLLVMVASQFRFGWAKPVPVNLMNVRNPRQADLWISAAGPLSNFGLAIIAAIFFRVLELGVAGYGEGASALSTMMWYAVRINLGLAFFNLIPLFPLDGSHILRSLLPPRYEEALERFESVAPFVLLGMVIFGFTWVIIGPPVVIISRVLTGA
ncbi:MAG: site-2 protease family protein [bacterium]|nr:site-2 protease family protein [bacterium]